MASIIIGKMRVKDAQNSLIKKKEIYVCVMPNWWNCLIVEI